MMHGFTSAGLRDWRQAFVQRMTALALMWAGVSIAWGQPGITLPAGPSGGTAARVAAETAKLTLNLFDPPPVPFRAVANVKRLDGPAKDTVRSVIFGDGISGGLRTHVPMPEGQRYTFQVVENFEPGEYNITINAIGFREARKKITLTAKSVPLVFDKLTPFKAPLTILGGTGGVNKPEVKRAAMTWNPKNGSWEKIPGQFESVAMPLTFNLSNKGDYSTTVAPGHYQVTVLALLTGLPVTREVTVDADGASVAFSRDEVEKKPSLTITVDEMRPGESFRVRNMQGGFEQEIQPNKPLTLPSSGRYETLWVPGPGQQPIPVGRDNIGSGADFTRTLVAKRFNKGAVWIESENRLKLEFLDPDNKRYEPFSEVQGDKRYFWLPAGKAMKWQAVHETNQRSAPETLPVLEAYTWNYPLVLPTEEEFHSGRLTVKVGPRDEAKIPELIVQFFAAGKVVKEILLSQPSEDVVLPLGTLEMRATAVLADGRRRAQKVPRTVRIVAAATGVSPVETIDVGQFSQGSLVVTHSGFSTPPVITAQQIGSGSPKIALRGETLVPEGRWRVTAEVDGKSISRDVPVSFEEPGTWNINADQYSRGALAIYTSTSDRGQLTLRRGDGAGQAVTIPALSDVTDEMSSLDKLYRAEIGRFDGGAVEGGLEEGAWVLSAFDREVKFMLKGGSRQAVVVYENASREPQVSDLVRSRVTLATLAPDPASQASTAKQGATKKEPEAGPRPSVPKFNGVPNQADEPWSTGQAVKIELEGRPLTLNWVSAISGWVAATTVANADNLPQPFSYAEAKELIEKLNADPRYKTQRGGHVFALPRLQDWQSAAGTRTRDQLATLIGRGALERVDARIDRGFSHLYGNVWQWVQPENDANGNERLRVVGGSFITKLEQMPDSAVSYIKTDRRRENIGLRIVLVKP